MTTIAEVLAWDPGRLVGITDTLLARKRDLVDLQDGVDGARPPLSWYGSAAEEARVRHEGLRLRLLDIVAEVAKVAASVDFAEVEVKRAQDDLQAKLDQAGTRGFSVDHQTGEITDPQTYDDDEAADAAAADLQRLAQEISTALTAAQTADQDLADALRSANDGLVEGGWGDLGAAAVQLPGALEDMSDEELAFRYADDVALETVRAYINAEVDFASFELEGGAEAKYVVRGDGSVVMSLHLEGGLGRGIDVGDAAEASLSGGVTTDLDLEFASREEADAFLAGLPDAALDFEWYEYGNAPAAAVANVADYVTQQNITSFRTGVYAQADAEFDTAWASVDGSGRIEGYRDWVKDEYGIKITANVEAQTGGVGGDDHTAAAGLTGEVKIDTDGRVTEAVFTGRISATLAHEQLGLDLPGDTGAGADVEIKVDGDNPHYAEFEEALSGGRLDDAAALALAHGRVVVRAVAIEELGGDTHEVEVLGQGGRVEYGATAEVADQIWVRPAGQDYVLPIDAEEAAR